MSTLIAGTKHFSRSIQKDDYSCGSRSAFMIAKHFDLGLSYADVKEAVRTTEDGTSVRPMIDFFRKHGLRVGVYPALTMRGLELILTRGAVLLVDLDGDHWGVVHGLTQRKVYLADPSIARQWGRKISRLRFRGRWGRWAMSVRE